MFKLGDYIEVKKKVNEGNPFESQGLEEETGIEDVEYLLETWAVGKIGKLIELDHKCDMYLLEFENCPIGNLGKVQGTYARCELVLGL